MNYTLETAIVALGAFLALLGAAFAHDSLFAAHMWVLFFTLLVSTVLLLRRVSFAPVGSATRAHLKSEYFDEVVKYGVIATVFWGVVGFLVGVVVALQLAFPDLNIAPYFNFGRMRPLHTSAVIFAFGGNALIATSFYVVQRTCRARLFGGNLGWFVFWGYNLFIVMAATGYLLGITQGREYAEPEWYVDIWLTIVWVAYLLVFLGTILTRKEPHIYVANWFYLSFIVTIAMLHIVNNLAIPVSFLGVKSYSAFSGVQDALTQWWYGHNAVGFFLTAGFLGMMYYFIPKQVNRPVYSYRLSIIHFWALIFMYIWAGPHHLHYTALPDWAQTLGPHRAHDGDGGGLLRHGDLRRSDDVDQGRQLAQPLYRLDHRPCAFGCSRLERHDHLRRDLLPDAETVGQGPSLQPATGQLALLARHARHRRLRRRHVGGRHPAGSDVARI